MKAIDIHAHLAIQYGVGSMEKLNKAIENYYGYKTKILTEEEMAQECTEADVKGILIGIDAESVLGSPGTPHDYVAQVVKDYPEAFIGAKFQSIVQAFFPNDRRFYPIYEKCAELGVPVQFHMGMTGGGAGMPGGLVTQIFPANPQKGDQWAVRG